MSTANYQPKSPATYTVGHYDAGRMLASQQLEKVSVATHPPSYTNSPVSLIYQPDAKRSFLFQSNLSNPERHHHLSKSGETSCGPEQLNYQPNVQYCVVEKHKTSTPTHSTSYTDGGKGAPVPVTFTQRNRKGSGELCNKPMESPTVFHQERRMNIQQPHTVMIRTTVGSPQYPQTDGMKSTVMGHPHLAMPMSNSPIMALNEHNLEAGNTLFRITGQPCVVVRGSPSSNYSDNRLTVKFEYQQPSQEQKQQKNRLDHIKNKTYAELVGRPSLPTEPNTERIMGSRYSVGQDDSRSMTMNSSMRDLNPKLTQSMHTLTIPAEFCQLEMKSVQSQTDKPPEKVMAQRRPELAQSVRSSTESETVEGANLQQDNAFKKDKRSSMEPSKSIYNPTKQSPQNAPLKKEAELRKSAKLSQTPEVEKNNTIDYLKPARNTPVDEFGTNAKYSPTSFTKIKTEEAASAAGSLNRSFTKQTANTSPSSSCSGSPTKMIRKRPCLADFNIGRKLGKGRYGDVYMVEHKFTGFLCAMKMIEKSLIRQQEVEHTLLREIKLQSYLRNEHIVQLYGYFDDEEKFYLLLEYCSDGELADLLKQRKRLSEDEASNIVDQLCRGIDFMHRHRIIHRDLKPENILMQDGIVKVCDFGWAAHVANGLRQTFCGTPLYVSPEVLKGDFYDDKIDIWAIGVLTYELLVGKVPFRINCESDLSKIVPTIINQINDQLVFPDYVIVSEIAKDFIRKALHKNPNSRIQMDELLSHPFLSTSKRREYMRHLA